MAEHTSERNRTRIRREALSLDEAVTTVERSSAGAIATFCGVVRDHNEGRAVSLLEYEAYVTMAEKELQKIEAEIERATTDVHVFATHRIGTLRVGDVAVVCAASAPHRTEAFCARVAS